MDPVPEKRSRSKNRRSSLFLFFRVFSKKKKKNRNKIRDSNLSIVRLVSGQGDGYSCIAAERNRWTRSLSCTRCLMSCFTGQAVELLADCWPRNGGTARFRATISFGGAGVMERIGDPGRGPATCAGIRVDRMEHRAHLCRHDALLVPLS